MKKTIKFGLVTALTVGSVVGASSFTVFANEKVEYNNVYEEISLNFFKDQYSERNMFYNSLNISMSKEMYNNNGEAVGRVVIINRDEQLDYVVYNYTTNQIDEFAFNESDAEEKFAGDIYYTGVLSYYSKEGTNYKHLENDSIVSKVKYNSLSSTINKKLAKYKNNLSKTMTCDGNPLPNPNKNGWNGFYNWSTIKDFNNNNDYRNSSWGYLSGVSWSGVHGSNLEFFDQNTFNEYFGTNNACGPTALTNMFIWFNYMGYKNDNGQVNALRNGSEFDTFNRFRTLVNHTNEGGTSRSSYNDALKNYAEEQGYSNYNLDTGVDTYSEFKENIDADRPVLTSISLDGWGGHAILCVGYEEFDHEYEEKHSFLWWDWTTTEHKYTHYLRVIDGWDTSNSSRFIDMSGYWDDVVGRGFTVND